MPTAKPRRGRPLKFNRPARAVALTLPDDVVDVLRAADDDLSRAVVRLAAPLATRPAPAPAEVARVGSGAVIIVPPDKALASVPGVELVPLIDGRALISLDNGWSVPEFELALRDRLDDTTRPLTVRTRELFQSLCRILQRARQSGGVHTRRIMVVPAGLAR